MQMTCRSFRFLCSQSLISFLILLTFTGCFKKKETPKVLPKALIVVSSHDQLGDTGKSTGWYLSEVTHIYYPLISAGFDVDFASPKGGDAPLDPESRKMDDPLNKRFMDTPELTAKMKSTLKMSDIKSSDYKIVHYAGGHGTMWDFPDSPDIQRVTKEVYENGGIISAICHGPAALVNVKLTDGTYLVAGKKISAFTDAEEYEVELDSVVPFMLETELRLRDAEFDAGLVWEDKVSVSERLITGQNPQSGHSLAKKLIETYQKVKAQEEEDAKAAAAAVTPES